MRRVIGITYTDGRARDEFDLREDESANVMHWSPLTVAVWDKQFVVRMAATNVARYIIAEIQEQP